MAHPRTPLAKAQLTGAVAEHPGRFRDRTEPKSEPIGAAPSWLSPEAKKAWRAFVREWSWLTKSDEAALAPLAVMRSHLETTPIGDLPVKFLSEYRLQLSSFGGNPTTKTKVAAPRSEEPEDPFAAFGGRPQ